MVEIAPLGFETHAPLVNPINPAVAESIHGEEPPRGANPVDPTVGPGPKKTPASGPPAAKAGNSEPGNRRLHDEARPRGASSGPILLSSGTMRAILDLLAPLPGR